MDLTSKAGLHDPFYPKSAIVTAFEEIEQRICCIEKELEPIAALCGPGGVVFTDSLGGLINDCDTLFFDPINVRLGIGTNLPDEEIHIKTTTSIAEIKLEAVNHDAIITLLSDDTKNAYIDYEETSGNRWIVGSYATNDEFAFADGSAFSNSRRLSITRDPVGIAASTIRLWEGGASNRFIGIKAPDSIVTNNIYTLPTDYPATAGETLVSDGFGTMSWTPATQSMIIAVSDETTPLTTGAAKVTFRMPYDFQLSEVRASVTTAPIGSEITVDINEAGSTILGDKIDIDDGTTSSTDAATQPTITDAVLADTAEITIDIDAVGSGTAGAGLKVYLIGVKT